MSFECFACTHEAGNVDANNRAVWEACVAVVGMPPQVANRIARLLGIGEFSDLRRIDEAQIDESTEQTLGPADATGIRPTHASPLKTFECWTDDRVLRQLPLDHALWDPVACDDAADRHQTHKEMKADKDGKKFPKRGRRQEREEFVSPNVVSRKFLTCKPSLKTGTLQHQLWSRRCALQFSC